MKGLEGKSIVVIGGTSGLGLSAAKSFVREGARVLIVGQNAQKLASAKDALGASEGLCGDARKPETAIAAIDLAMHRFGNFTGLYHVAGGSGRAMGDAALHELTDSAWAETLSLNLSSVFFSNRAAVKTFLKHKTKGTILNCGSVLGFSPSSRFFSTHAYATAKSAIIGFTKSCAATYAAEGIRFNLVAPALVATPMSKRAQGNVDILNYARAKQPLAKNAIGDVRDVDGIAIYFMSDASCGTTGQVLSVDWGWCISDGNLL